MSAGPGAEGARPPGPVPVRQGFLQKLQRELQHARDAGERDYAARLEADIARLSQGSPADPRTETASAARPRATAKRRTR